MQFTVLEEDSRRGRLRGGVEGQKLSLVPRHEGSVIHVGGGVRLASREKSPETRDEDRDLWSQHMMVFEAMGCMPSTAECGQRLGEAEGQALGHTGLEGSGLKRRVQRQGGKPAGGKLREGKFQKDHVASDTKSQQEVEDLGDRELSWAGRKAMATSAISWERGTRSCLGKQEQKVRKWR